MKMIYSDTSFRVPRSRAYETHDAYRSEILSSLEPVLFGSSQAGYRARHKLEETFAEMVGRQHACAVHSGTIGLFLALRACGIGPGDSVITVANSDISTTSAIRQCGALPILCDVHAHDFTLDCSQVEALITPATRAILPVDIYGHPADVRSLREIADRHGLMIIEDAALATGANDYGRPVGSFSDVAVFSFAPFKPLGSTGNGAMVVADDPQLALRIRQLCEYGSAPHSVETPEGYQFYVAEGYNVPLDPLQAALLQIKIPFVAEWTRRRQAIAEMYEVGFRGTAVRTPQFREVSAPTFRCYTVRVPDRQRVYAALREAGVEVVIHYAPPVYRHPGYSGEVPKVPLAVTETLSTELLCLPVTPELTVAEVTFTVEQLLACL
jgi:dTDP-4-amino-4,6-dideoxygalactose transaminase